MADKKPKRNVLKLLGQKLRAGFRQQAGQLTVAGAEALGRRELAGVSLAEIRSTLGVKTPGQREQARRLLEARIEATEELGKRRLRGGRLRDIASESKLFLLADKKAESKLKVLFDRGLISEKEMIDRQESFAIEEFDKLIREKKATVGKKRPEKPAVATVPKARQKIRTIVDAEGNRRRAIFERRPDGTDQFIDFAD